MENQEQLNKKIDRNTSFMKWYLLGFGVYLIIKSLMSFWEADSLGDFFVLGFINFFKAVFWPISIIRDIFFS